ncbi:hypothetical protein [Mucilaginibacter sp. NFR10]|uniref:hypothetical protein n=1 Tax=Mucilaginibacter sp. NFR10 TaxID=1566292 RepID=UPI0008715A71|nr:hypothetical protein [Mucilaginibacter sp. NFR10]SCW66077.1 hypothetical protein SAMN03159284_02919 [Mucilaginibacter sp. NFR10]
MKKLTLITILFVFISNYLFAQWTTSGTNIYTNNAGSVVIGATTPTVVNASAALFPSVTSKFNVVTGTGPATFADLVVLNHPGVNVDAVQRQIGLVFKLSSESTTGESDKMGGMLLESSNGYANLPSFSLVTGNIRRLTIDASGNVGIGKTDPQNKLDVNGTIHSKSVLIDLNGWSDYVFKKDYRLAPLSEVEAYIDQNQHLPEIPSEQEMTKKGLNVSEMNKLLMKKVEELTLYAIENEQKDKEKDKLLVSLQEQINLLKQQLKPASRQAKK